MTLAIGISITRVNVGKILYQGFKIYRYVTLNVRLNLDIKAVHVYRSNLAIGPLSNHILRITNLNFLKEEEREDVKFVLLYT